LYIGLVSGFLSFGAFNGAEAILNSIEGVTSLGIEAAVYTGFGATAGLVGGLIENIIEDKPLTHNLIQSMVSNTVIGSLGPLCDAAVCGIDGVMEETVERGLSIGKGIAGGTMGFATQLIFQKRTFAKGISYAFLQGAIAGITDV
jgi:hypothetical protein